LTSSFQLDVSNLPADYWDDPSAYRNFITRYGTHWIESVVLGKRERERACVSVFFLCIYLSAFIDYF